MENQTNNCRVKCMVSHLGNKGKKGKGQMSEPSVPAAVSLGVTG